ncbi:hypothetical protein [Streptomyces sp. NPDC018584]|uniref:hypothetical protein n=1 Tax=unclassified Streptomyces TaxID=2593676 RepID=UPI003790C359
MGRVGDGLFETVDVAVRVVSIGVCGNQEQRRGSFFLFLFRFLGEVGVTDAGLCRGAERRLQIRMGLRVPVLQARRRPPVPGIGDEGAEHLQVALLPADRGPHHLPAREPAGEVRLDILRRPVPRVGARERGEPPHQTQPVTDRLPCQQPALLLLFPAAQHRLEQRRGRIQRAHVVRPHQPDRTR